MGLINGIRLSVLHYSGNLYYHDYIRNITALVGLINLPIYRRIYAEMNARRLDNFFVID